VRTEIQTLLLSHKAHLKTIRKSAPLMLGILLGACAASPPKAPTAVAAGVAKQPAAAQTGAAYETAELDRRARLMGYHVENRNQERLYCQHSSPVGTHIATNHCLNAELMSQAARDDEELKNKLSLRGNQLCPGCIQKND
jgi:hypothetical protein